MIEDNVLKDDRVFEGLFLVALEATGVIDLGMGFRDLLSCDEIDKGYLTVFPFSLYMVDETRFVMAINTGDVLMVRCLPRFHVDCHVVANAAEKRLFRYLERCGPYDKSAEHYKREKNRHAGGVLLCPFLRFSVKVPQERSNKLKQIPERSGIVLFHNPPGLNSLKGADRPPACP